MIRNSKKVFYPVRLDTYSPISTIFREVGKRIPHQVTAFSNDDKEFDTNGIKTIQVKDQKLSKIKAYFLENLKSSQYDIVHTGPFPHNLLSCLKNYKSDTYHVHTVHNAEWGIKRGIYPVIHRRVMVKECDRLTAVSKYAASKMQSKINNIYEPTVIPNGVDIKKFSPDRAKTKDNRILYVGRADSRKHPEIVPCLAERLPQYSFRVRISGVDKCPHLREKLNKQENIELLNRLSTAELAKEYASASAFLAPYEREAFGMTILESLSSGTPVIGYSSGNVRELVGSNNGILINNLTCKGWVESIRNINQTELSRSARESALPYSWDKVAKKYNNIY